MIYIRQSKPKSQVGLYSLFVSFDKDTKYDESLFKCIKQIPHMIYHKKDGKIEFPLTSLSILVDLLCVYDDIKIELLKDEINDDAEYSLKDYKTQPYEHQIKGIQYGLNHDKWLLLDEPGLGKTLETICLVEEIKKRENIQHCLIICGINTLKMNWVNEIHKHSYESCTVLGGRYNKKGMYVVDGVQKRLEQLKHPIDEFFVITNIETLRDDEIVKQINNGVNKFDMILFDECHKAKEVTSIQAKNLLKLTSAKYKVAMTGTLLMNNPLDTYVPLKWIGVENSSYTNFRFYYCTYGGAFNNILTGFKNMEVLKDEIDSCSLRRLKSLLNLPPKTLIDEYVEMSDAQRKFYDDVVAGVTNDVDKVKLTTTNLLSMISRLRQATACPTYLTTSNIPSAKVDRACDLVDEIISNGNKVVVFSTFKETVHNLKQRLAQYNPVSCTGDDKDDYINQCIDRFQTSPDCNVFLGTWQKCGTGITLTSATYMIFIDTPWTSAAYLQAQDRIYRIGTKDNVTIYNLMCKDSIDERVLEILNDKSALSDYIIDDTISQSGLDSLRKYIQEL